ncbi:MAG: hypothetical protein EXR69_11060 [Myxococcales bacterium]|nr:hypothetical protein [Myxococcales bacterium]
MALAAGGRQAPRCALTVGAGGSAALVEVALERAHAGEPDEAIVFGEAAVAVANQQGSGVEAAAAAVVTASLYAASGDCSAAVEHARVAHIALGADLPKLDQAVRACFQTQGP